MEGLSARILIADTIIKCANKYTVYCRGSRDVMLINPVMRSQYYHSSREQENFLTDVFFIETFVFQLNDEVIEQHKERVNQEYVQN